MPLHLGNCIPYESHARLQIIYRVNLFCVFNGVSQHGHVIQKNSSDGPLAWHQTDIFPNQKITEQNITNKLYFYDQLYGKRCAISNPFWSTHAFSLLANAEKVHFKTSFPVVSIADCVISLFGSHSSFKCCFKTTEIKEMNTVLITV